MLPKYESTPDKKPIAVVLENGDERSATTVALGICVTSLEGQLVVIEHREETADGAYQLGQELTHIKQLAAAIRGGQKELSIPNGDAVLCGDALRRLVDHDDHLTETGFTVSPYGTRTDVAQHATTARAMLDDPAVGPMLLSPEQPPVDAVG